jgi:L-alanine-DL-glutamate epimerase-like enolase superfamily enzyme
VKIIEARFHAYALPYTRTVRWFNSEEDHGVFVLLRLTGDDGTEGVAEATVKPTWSGVSVRSLRAVIEDLLIPALADVDVLDAEAVAAALARFPENHLAKMLMDNACWTMRAARHGRPLWDLFGGTDEVELSWTVTRAAPDRMAADAAEAVGRHGFAALKIKGGQGLQTDLAALSMIRAAVGAEVSFTVDANSAYRVDEAPDYVRAIAEAGAVVAEDPCPLRPDAAFEALVRDSTIPVLVDSPCRSLRDAVPFAERGATALSVKPGRIGFTEARKIVDMARSRGIGVCSGMYAESALGTLLSLQFSAALRSPVVPAEQSFFLGMREQVLRELPEIRNGRIKLSRSGDYSAPVDWERVARFEIGSQALNPGLPPRSGAA